MPDAAGLHGKARVTSLLLSDAFAVSWRVELSWQEASPCDRTRAGMCATRAMRLVVYEERTMRKAPARVVDGAVPIMARARSHGAHSDLSSTRGVSPAGS